MLEMQKADIYIFPEKRSKDDLQSMCDINGCWDHKTLLFVS